MGEIYETLTNFESTGLLLRDFFISYDSTTLRRAYSALDKNAASLTEQEWLKAEYDFNALFVGPQKLKAAPFASVYLEEDALVMGKSTLSIREFMANIGLSINGVNNIPDDHISCVLELAVLLSANARASSEYQVTLTRYASEYIAMWVPEYIEKININAQTATLKNAAGRLSSWLDELKTRVSI
ncbi:TorD/DmsD family molecular chaperone [Citrobacter sp. FDAARGOS_156]|uniref:TorD/DmsD family molecular chaperone n=1 Tax=Citrobacter TaxID=544 RepID=UPI0019015319|nr:molecular chaperone TorD family protein [Citrobacter sp. FDAARGOS_156]MBJ8923778.1 molecular chaperone TorD family protein [Citrobacter sp. FDAARGOS_156]